MFSCLFFRFLYCIYVHVLALVFVGLLSFVQLFSAAKSCHVFCLLVFRLMPVPLARFVNFLHPHPYFCCLYIVNNPIVSNCLSFFLSELFLVLFWLGVVLIVFAKQSNDLHQFALACFCFFSILYGNCVV